MTMQFNYFENNLIYIEVDILFLRFIPKFYFYQVVNSVL